CGPVPRRPRGHGGTGRRRRPNRRRLGRRGRWGPDRRWWRRWWRRWRRGRCPGREWPDGRWRPCGWRRGGWWPCGWRRCGWSPGRWRQVGRLAAAAIRWPGPGRHPAGTVLMHAASRQSLAAARERLDAYVDRASPADLGTLADELFAVVDLLDSEPVL